MGYARYRIHDAGYEIQDGTVFPIPILHTPCAGFSGQAPGILLRSWPFIQVSGARYQVSGTGYLAPDTRTGFAPRAGHRAPKTEPSYRVCVFASRIHSPVSRTRIIALLPYCPTAQLPSFRTRRGDPYPGDRRGSSDTRVSAALDGVVSASRRSKTHWSRT